LKRTDDVTQTLMGCCSNSHEAWSTVIADSVYEVAFNGGTPDRSRFILANSRNRWVHVVIPASPGVKVTRWSSTLTPTNSLAELFQKTNSAYYYDASTSKLHLRLWGADDYEELKVQIN